MKLTFAFLTFFLFFLGFLFLKPSDVKADTDCWIYQVVQSGRTFDPVLVDVEENIPFDLKINCTSFFPAGTYNVTAEIGGNSITRSLSGAPAAEFGTFPGLAAGNGTSYPLNVSIPGTDGLVFCGNHLNSPLNRTACRIYVSGTTPLPTVLPPPRSCVASPSLVSPGNTIDVTGFNMSPSSPVSIIGGFTVPLYDLGDLGDSPLTIPPEAQFGLYRVRVEEPSGNFTYCTPDINIGEENLSPGRNPCGVTCITGIGSIPTNFGAFASRLIAIALGIGGGLALILMVFGAIRVLTSTGNPQNVNQGREIMIAAVAGLLFIAFAVLILQFIGVVIVPIPGLQFGVPR